MKVRFSKVRITDHRPPGAGGKQPLEAGRLTRGGSVGMTGLDHLNANQMREAAEHDRAVRDYLPQTVAEAWDDLSSRKHVARPARDADKAAWDAYMEYQWVIARRAALRRLGSSMRERGVA